MKSIRPHPLAEIVLKAFAENDYQDATTLAVILGGATTITGANKAYHTVARDVLGYMESQGVLTRSGGWYKLATPRTR